MEFHGGVKNLADLTKAYKDVRVATNVATVADLTLSSGSPEKLLPQTEPPALRPSIDLSRTCKALVAKTCVSKLRSSGADTSSDAC